MDEMESRFAELEGRVRKLEDELEIHRLMVSYGFAADTGDAERVAQRFTEEGVYDVEGVMAMEGRGGIRNMILGPRHQSLLPNCAHTVGPTAVNVDGDRAVAVGYSRTYKREGDEIKLWRLAYNRTELQRRDGRWQIVRRKNRMVGHEEAGALFRDGLTSFDA
jgi:uncharacterized protein (TIGR02246 family)